MKKKIQNTELFRHLNVINDPRMNRTKKHLLIDIIVIAICGMIAKNDSWVEIEAYGNAHKKWFKKFLKLPNGIPSHDTFGRVFSMLDENEFQLAFYNWVREVFDINTNEIIAIDGKYIKATDSTAPQDGKNPKKMMGSVNAWVSGAGVALAQLRADYDKNAEQLVFKRMIDFLDLKNNIVTMDAAGASAEGINNIIDKGGDYCVALKRNQRNLYKTMRNYIEENKVSKDMVFESTEKSHGREETRIYTVYPIPNDLIDEMIDKSKEKRYVPKKWKSLNRLIKVNSKRVLKGRESEEERLYLSSLESSPERFADIIRSHWGIENKLHWVLDVTFNEDKATNKKGAGSGNLSLVRKFALNLLKNETSIKKSMNIKRSHAAWNTDYLLKVITGGLLDE